MVDDRRLLTLDDIERALTYINGYNHRPTWLQVGMGIKAEFGENGFDIFDKWSQQWDKYNAKQVKASWKSFRRQGFSIGTVIKYAMDGGFKFDQQELTAEEKARRREAAKKRDIENKARELAEQEADKKAKADTAARAGWIWPRLPREGHSPYLQRKGIHHFDARFGKNNSIAIPVIKNDQLINLQWIQKDGEKKFMSGGEKSGASYVIRPDSTGPRILCTGYATGCSIAMAVANACVEVCFDDGNLVTVARERVKTHPGLIIAADNDHGKPNNSGLEHAKRIVDECNVRAVWPEGISGSDFNDLQVEKGASAVEAAFSGNKQQDFPPLGGESSAKKSPKPKKPAGPPPAMAGRGGFVFSVESMLENYAHVYGKTAQIFDKRARKLISPGTLLEIAESAYKDWKKRPERHIVDETGVVFDPSMQSDPETTVNLFGGFPLEPQAGECASIIELLDYLVGGNDEVFKWLIRWIAYPLQNPGAKMRTAVVMHGSEGAGKNLFWSVIERIYGEYSTIITQNEIESQFNGWASKKLFVIGNEVVSRQEMYHKKGIIKNMITEPEWLINDKNMPLRREANHANFVFFSNVMQPVTPDTGDRRFMVIWTPKKQGLAYYQGVVNEIKNGGVEAFYQYLLDYDLGDFTEFTEPVMTGAKDNLIDLSMRSDERFIKRWKEGDTPLPYSLCLSVDLFAAYQHWARVEGEKFTVSMTEFSMRLARDEEITVTPRQEFTINEKTRRSTLVEPPGAWARQGASQTKKSFAGLELAYFASILADWRGGERASA
jgi:putative DNA primase/helicase